MTRRDPIDGAHRQWVKNGWSSAADGMASVTRLVRVNQIAVGHIDRLLKPHELTFARFEVLRLLAFARGGTLPMGRLGALLQVHPASVTHAVGRLESAGLVNRQPNPADQRSTLASILPAGRTAVEAATEDLNEFFADVSTVPDLDTLRNALLAVEAKCIR